MKPGQLWCVTKYGFIIYLLKKGNRNNWKAILVHPGKWTYLAESFLSESCGGPIDIALSPNNVKSRWRQITFDELKASS